MVHRHGHFAWYELLTTDMAGARAFYGGVLGWSASAAAAPKFAYTIFSAVKKPVCGLMELPLEGRNMGATPRWVGYVAVDDVDRTVDRLRGLGGAVYVPPTDTNIGRISIVADPQRATFALAQGLSISQQEEADDKAGRIGWHELLATDWKTAFAFYSEVFGWQRAESEQGSLRSYQLMTMGGRTIGGIFNKLPIAPFPFWLYYFNVPDIAVATERVLAGGGQVVQGPINLNGAGWIACCIDPQGAMFALQAAENQTGVERLSPAELGWSAAWGDFSSRGRLLANSAPNPKSRR